MRPSCCRLLTNSPPPQARATFNWLSTITITITTIITIMAGDVARWSSYRRGGATIITTITITTTITLTTDIEPPAWSARASGRMKMFGRFLAKRAGHGCISNSRRLVGCCLHLCTALRQVATTDNDLGHNRVTRY